MEYEGCYGVYYKQCNEIISCGYDEIKVIDNNFLVRCDNCWGLLDSNGMEIILIVCNKVIENNDSYIFISEDFVKKVSKDNMLNDTILKKEELIDFNIDINIKPIEPGLNYGYSRTKRLKPKRV